MANRLILGAFANTYVLRLSRPGYNVFDDGLPPEVIAFDSRWPKVATVLASGVARGKVWYQDMLGWMWYCDFWAPAGLSYIPQVIGHMQTEDGNVYGMIGGQSANAGLYAAAYDPGNGMMRVAAAFPWFSAYPNNVISDWGYLRYYLVQRP